MTAEGDAVSQTCPVCGAQFLVKTEIQGLLLQCTDCGSYIKNGRKLEGEAFQAGMKLVCKSCGRTLRVVDEDRWEILEYRRCKTMCAITDA